jgi:alcohol dehydrogenase
MTIRMKGAVLYATGAVAPYQESRPLCVEDVELDPPGPGEVMVRIAAAGLCHSDLSVINGDRPRPVPMLLGHEAAGAIEEVGEGVADLQKGDHVVLVFVPSCGSCINCAEGRPALCEPGAAANTSGVLLSGARRLSRNGHAIHHHLGCSAFAEHATVSRRSVVKIDRDLPLQHAALFGCAVLTGVGAVVNTAKVSAGQRVAIVGLGGVGLAALLGALASGASRILAVDIDRAKLARAKELGATDVLDAGAATCVDEARSLTSGGVDVAFEFAGSSQAMDLAFRVTRRGGTTVTASLPRPTQALQVPHVSLVAEERTVKGSYIGSSVPARDLPRYIALYQQGRLPVDKLLTHRLALEEINAGFERLRVGDAIRQVIAF